jgi:hypothetical protein
MKILLAMGSLSRGMEVDEAPIKDDAMTIPGEDTVIMSFRRQPLPEKGHMLVLGTGTP